MSRITPGEIAFTRTPAGPNSAAHARVSVSTAPLVELYSAEGMPRRAIHEPRLMIAPLPRSAICGAITAVRKNGALTFTAYTRSKTASSVAAVAPPGKIPALLTSTSIRPPRTRPASSASRRAAAGDPSRSAATKSARPPAVRICATTAAPRSALRPLTATCAPSAPNATAMARPMLLVDPVIKAVLPARRSLIWVSLRASCRWTNRSSETIT